MRLHTDMVQLTGVAVSFLLVVLGNNHVDAESACIVYRSSPNFAIDVSKLTLENVQDIDKEEERIVTAGGKRYQLRFNKDLRFFQERVLAEKLYDVLSVPTPEFVIIKNISSLPQEVQSLVRYMPFVKIREYIPREKTEVDDALDRAKYFQSHFVVDAFLGNRDAGSGMEIAPRDGQYIRIDTSYALRNRGAAGSKIKKRSEYWDPYLLPEMKALKKSNKSLYGTVTEEQFTAQAKHILSKAAALAEAFEQVAMTLMLSADMREELSNMLARRLQVLQMLVIPGTAYRADMSRPVSGLTAAGMFLVCDLNGVAQVLLGARKSSHTDSNNTWVTLGGKSDFPGDKSLLQTANREIYEETTGLLNILAPLAAAPFHDLVHEDFLFRLYFVHVGECFSVDTLHQAHRPTSLRHNHHTGSFEYHRFRWFPVKAMRSVSPDGVIADTTEKMYLPFATMLQVPHVQSVIERFERNQSVVDNRYTQSAPVKGAVATNYGTFPTVALGDTY